MRTGGRVIAGSLPLAAAALLAATGARAGQIQGLTLEPAETAYTFQAVEATVTGSKACANGVVVEFAPGVTEMQSGGGFPMTFQHVYQAPGRYNVKAYPNPADDTGCSSTDPSAGLEVIDPGDRVERLCDIVDCEAYIASLEVEDGAAAAKQRPEVAIRPRIDSVWAAHLPGAGFPAEPAVLTPGARVHLKGEGFGDRPGQILLRGPLAGSDQVALADLEWDEDGETVSGKIPTGTDAPLRVDVELQVVSRWGQASNPFGREFETPGRIVHVDPDSALVELVQCGDGANRNYCTALQEVEITQSCSGNVMWTAWNEVVGQIGSKVGFNGGFTFKAMHGNCHTDVNRDTGTDRWLVDLRDSPTHHGCVIYDVNVGIGKSRQGDVLYAGESAKGLRYFNPVIDWEVSPADWVGYAYSVWIKCPHGEGSS